MKDFMDFYLSGSHENLMKFVTCVPKYITGEWRQGINSMFKDSFVVFVYEGDKVDKANVFLYIKNINELKFHVSNIVPIEKDSLSYEEYNRVLEKCIKECIIPCANECGLSYNLTNENVELENYMSNESAKKLKRFSSVANKSTGSSHPCDRDRWNDFICQTFIDGHHNVTVILGRWLAEEEGWGDEQVSELVIEYEKGISLLHYYREHYNDQT